MHPATNTPYNFARTRREPILGGSCFSSMKNTVLDKVYCALATSFDIAIASIKLDGSIISGKRFKTMS